MDSTILIQEFLKLANTATFQDLSVLFSIFIVTWIYSIHGKFLIDDHEGIETYQESWDPKEKKKIDTYDHELPDGTKKTLKKFQYNKYISSDPFVCAWRWIRINIGKKFKIIGRNEKGHEVYGYGQSPVRHHIFSLVVHFMTVVMSYVLLSKLFGRELAFYSTVLFTVHPISSQAVAWISGVGYTFSMLFILLTIYAGISLPDIASIVPSAFLTYISTTILLSGLSTFVILFFLGKYVAGISSMLVSLVMLYFRGIAVSKFRKQQFESQNMKQGTIFHAKKIVVIVKTLYYNIKMLFFPRRLGLFHKWGYHYDVTLEAMDGMFIKGVLTLLGFLVLFLVGSHEIRFGILWMFSFMILFSNVITAQQFVADRYSFISSLGFCVIISKILMPYPIAFWFVIGILMMRTWVHLTTFLDEISFYQSNLDNFPDSEVAYGNIGVIYNSVGMQGTAADSWSRAIQINQHYDVPYYNLSSLLKATGNLELAEINLKKCLDCKIVHFKDKWQKELEELQAHLAAKKKVDELNVKMNLAVREGRYDQIDDLKRQILEIKNPAVQPSTPIANPS